MGYIRLHLNLRLMRLYYAFALFALTACNSGGNKNNPDTQLPQLDSAALHTDAQRVAEIRCNCMPLPAIEQWSSTVAKADTIGWRQRLAAVDSLVYAPMQHCFQNNVKLISIEDRYTTWGDRTVEFFEQTIEKNMQTQCPSALQGLDLLRDYFMRCEGQ